MEKNDLHSPIAVTYAEALLDLAGDDAEIISDELAGLKQVLLAEPMSGPLFGDPAIGQDERSRLLDRVFRGRVTPLLMNFLHVLNAKGRLGFLSSIADAFRELLDHRQGKVEVDVTVAQRLSPEAIGAVGQRISNAIKRQAILHQYVDPAIIGGLILRVGDKLIDGSVRAQLEMLRTDLRAARPV